METKYSKQFVRVLRQIKNKALLEKIKKQIIKIQNKPKIGKPMRYNRRGTRELYVSPFRISYSFENEVLSFLSLYHKDEQ